MVNSLRRHIMQQVSGGGVRWNYGVRYAATNSSTIVEDANYAISEPIEISTTVLYYKGYSNVYDSSCIKELNSNLQIIDYWGAFSSTIRSINVNANTKYITICAKIEYIPDTGVFYLAADPINSYYYFQGSNQPNIVDDNNVAHYYAVNNQGFGINTNSCVNYYLLPVSNGAITFLSSARIFAYNTNGGYVDYWGGSWPNPRSLSMGSSIVYVRLNMSGAQYQDCYIKYTNTDEYIWKGPNV